MSELTHAISGDSAHTPPANILQALPVELATRRIEGAPHTIYAELWHITFWQQMSLDWIAGDPVPFPARPQDAFPTSEQVEAEPWEDLCARFAAGNVRAAELTKDHDALRRNIMCPSVPGHPGRAMTVEDQLISMAAHNAYHFGQIVLMRQMLGAWPPPSGGFTW